MPKFTVDYFIQKFEGIPSENIIGNLQSTDRGTRRCAIGWLEHDKCGNDHSVSKNPDNSTECKALEELFHDAGIESITAPENRIGWNIADVNNGNKPMFQQETPKDRILAALQYVKRISIGNGLKINLVVLKNSITFTF